MNTTHTTQPALDREAWLYEAGSFLLDARILPAAGMDTPPPWRVSVGFPTGRSAHKTAAVCFRRSASADGHSEIFCSPVLADGHKMLEALAHELIHACDDCASGHRNFFARVARKIGLEGPLTHTVAGADLAQAIDQLITMLGPMPHAPMSLAHRPKQSTRMHKVQCAGCGFTFRAAAAHIARLDANDSPCPACTDAMLVLPS